MQITIDFYDRRILQAARKRWGKQHELNMAMEESAETIAAINHVSRDRPDSKAEFLAEFSDAIVCNMQIVENEDWHDDLAQALQASVLKLEHKLENDDKNHKD